MLTLAFRGALPGGRVVLHDAFFPIPRWARERHGPRALAAQVQAERRRLATASPGPTLFETLGAQGSTQVTVEVERGSCYLATLALIRGTSRGLRLMARASAVTSYEEVPAPGEGAAVTFCADQDRVTLSADVPGVSVSWVLSLLALTPRPRPEGQQP